MTREAVIVSTARTPIGKAYRGAFNDTQAQALGGHAIKHAVDRAGIDPETIQDVIMGAALQQGSTSGNVARQCALRAGLPTTVSGMSMDRQCASGLMAIATAAKEIIVDNMDVAVAGGLESISLVQNDKMNTFRATDPWLKQHRPDIYMSMLETAEIVADRYNVSRDAQDEYAYQSQMRTAAAQQAGKFDDEIVPMTTVMKVMNKETKEISDKEITLFVGQLYAGRFACQVGADPYPEPGQYTVLAKQQGRSYYVGDGSVIPGGDPRNPYGHIWLDLGNQVCLHASAQSEEVATSQLGCIRMNQADSSDVYGILSAGSQVLIRR